MLCYVQLSLTQWLPRLVTAGFRYCGAPTESSGVAAPLQVRRSYTGRVCFCPPRSGSVKTDRTSVHSGLAILVHSRVPGLSCSSDYLSFKWSCMYVCVHVCCVCYVFVFVRCAFNALLPSPTPSPPSDRLGQTRPVSDIDFLELCIWAYTGLYCIT